MGRTLAWAGILAWSLAGPAEASPKADVSSLSPRDLVEFDRCSPEVREILRYALELTRRNLRYQYGSNDPADGGMDCSGTVSHVLNHLGYAAPRMAHTIYGWAEEADTLTRVKGCHDLDDRQLAELRPGDLLFWEGTYDVGERNPPISHVMIFLGRQKKDGKPVMVGASSGRYYGGRARHGVSVFDFRLPRPSSSSKFVAYARVPGTAAPVVVAQEADLAGRESGVPSGEERLAPAEEVAPVEPVLATVPAAAAPEREPAVSPASTSSRASSSRTSRSARPRATVRGALRKVFRR